MTAIARQLSMPDRLGTSAAFLACGTLALGAGAAVSAGRAPWILLATTLALAFVVGIANWRWSIYGLLAYLPLSGIPILVSYPDTTLALLAKDFLFVIPAYLGFLAYVSRRRAKGLFSDAPVALFLILALLVLAQTLNPALPNVLVGLIGLKVWLLYIPLYFLGYHLVKNERELFRLLGLMSVVALAPAAIGVAEAALIYTGSANRVYALYGDAAAGATQNFAVLGYEDGGALRRVPSTFSFVAQYYTFVATMVAITYAWWRGALVGTRHALLGRLAWLLMLAAAFLSGARGAFLLIPLLVVMILALERPRAVVSPARVLAPVAMFLAAVAFIGASSPAVVAHTFGKVVDEVREGFLGGFQQALGHTWLGLGTGTDTNAARYAFSDPSVFQGISGRWFEGWWVKALLELGVAGLIVAAALLGTIVVRGARRHFALHDRRLKVVSAAILAFLVWNLIYAVKGQYLDIDPINVYFWLLAGVLARIPALDREAAQEERAP